jgi:nitrite reductase (NO-forming)
MTDSRCRRLATATAGLALLALAGCGAARRAPAPSVTSSQGPSASSASASGSAGAASQPGAQYAVYYRADGAATLATGAPQPMTAYDFSFKPNTLSVKAGTVVRLTIANAAAEGHNFDLPAFGVDVALPAGATTQVTFTASRPGVYWFWCNLPGHQAAGMVGKLTVS